MDHRDMSYLRPNFFLRWPEGLREGAFLCFACLAPALPDNLVVRLSGVFSLSEAIILSL